MRRALNRIFLIVLLLAASGVADLMAATNDCSCETAACADAESDCLAMSTSCQGLRCQRAEAIESPALTALRDSALEIWIAFTATAPHDTRAIDPALRPPNRKESV